MPRRISHSRVYSVIKAAECFPFGASIKDILTIPMMRGTPKRTLQRDLDRLVQAGHLKLKGKGQHATLVERHHEILRQLLHRMRVQARSERLLVDFSDILAEATYVKNVMLNISGSSP
jgi:hypothetical protein